MIQNDILCLGLTYLQLHTLRCHFPIGFNFHRISADSLNGTENINLMVSKSWCVFINPKKLQPDQLKHIVVEHDYATRHSHAAILLFTEAFTAEQKKSIDTKVLHRVDLRAGLDPVLRDVIDNVRKATAPCWNGMARMRSNMFNDGWYLLDMETSGADPLEDDIISLSISYMSNYRILSTETIYIKQQHPISDEIESITEITNEMLASGITKEQAVEYLDNLPKNSPLIFASYRYYLPFIKALYHSCGKKFDKPYVEMDGLAAIAFNYERIRKPYDMLSRITQRKYTRTQVDHIYLAKLYDLTLAVFENMQDRYDVWSAGELNKLFNSTIECGE